MSRLVLAAALLSGCYKIDYVRDMPTSPMPGFQRWHHIGIFGLIEFSDPVPLQRICPTGFSRVHQEVSPSNAVVIILETLPAASLVWIYQPSTIQVFCNTGQAFEVEVDGEGMAVSATRTQ